ncbi:MAG TPA: flavodoxin family protein [Desulfuromonadales bacterium]|nr:flavodoxin family protein [Desulfuromonadales bacterium]
MSRTLVINGSYRSGGFTDQVVNVMAETLVEAGAEVEVVLLRSHPIEFCTNCRICTQPSGKVHGTCVIHDGMAELIGKIEKSDSYIFATPTNFGSATALFMRFVERLVVYADWPWGSKCPKMRTAEAVPKRAVLVSSCAAPGLLGRWSFGTRRQLKTLARILGADPVGLLFVGQVALHPQPQVSDRTRKKARHLAGKLI